MRKIFLVFFFAVAFLTSHAQNFKYGAIERADFNYDRKQIDSNANAVVLREFGNAFFEVNESSRYIEVVLIYHVRIKIYNEKGFDQATVTVPLYKDEEVEDRITNVEASTYNWVNNRVEETKLDTKKVFEENKSKYTRLAKFTMPNVKAGSIIEYTYRVSTPRFFKFRTWEFQSDIPKVYSEFVASIPPVYNYNVSLRGPLKLSKSDGVIQDDCVVISGTRMQCSKMTYAMNNIPAFYEEDYMTAAANFKSAIYFQLSDETRLEGGKKSYTKSWADVDVELTNNKSFGTQMKRKDIFKDKVPAMISGATDDLSKAKAVYSYIKKEMKWNGYYGMFSESDNIKKALDTHTGNVADINLSLVAALNAAGLDADAVILSTREQGQPNKLFPTLTDFNYVVAKVNIGTDSYMLDATEPLLQFGLLPLRCINDQGRVFNFKKASYWIDMKASQKSQTTYLLNGELNENGKITGKMIIHSQGYAAFNKRKEIKAKNTVEEFVEQLDEKMAKISILKHKVSNLDSLEATLTEEYDVEFQVFDGSQGDKFYLNPFLVNKITTNPFKLEERSYPVDMGAASSDQSMINIKLNGNFVLEEKPKDIAIALPESSGKFILKTELKDNVLSINQSIQVSKPIFEPYEYPALKAFYSQIIQSHNTEFLLQKAK